MIVYHGSGITVDKPDVNHSIVLWISEKDFM